MYKNKILVAITIIFILITVAGCASLEAPDTQINGDLFSDGDQIAITWDAIDNAESYKVYFYLYPLSDDKLSGSVELPDTSWQGTLPIGKYDIVVSALKNNKPGESSAKMTVEIQPKSIPSWSDIEHIFSSAYEDIETVYGEPAVESDTGEAIIRSYDEPIIDLFYPDDDDICSQIDIYDPDYILLGLSIGTNTQAQLLSALNNNEITYENSTVNTSAGLSVSTKFTYNDYVFIVYIDANDILSYITINPE